MKITLEIRNKKYKYTYKISAGILYASIITRTAIIGDLENLTKHTITINTNIPYNHELVFVDQNDEKNYFSLYYNENSEEYRISEGDSGVVIVSQE